MKYLFTTLSLLVGMGGCIEEDIKTVPSFFEIKIDESFTTAHTDNWIFIHDSQGLVLDTKRFESGETKILRNKKVTGKFTVTFMTINESGYSILKSYAGITRDQKWRLRNDLRGNDPGLTGAEITVTITDPDLGDYTNAAVSSALITYQVASANENSFLFYPAIVLGSNNDMFIFCTDKGDKPLYQFVENATPGNANYDLSDFNEFDATVDIEFPSTANYYVTVKGFSAEVEPNRYLGYSLNYFLSLPPAESESFLVLGYLDQFPNSLTYARATYDGYDLGYEAYGPRPGAPISVQNNIGSEIVNNTFGSFELSSSADFDWYHSTWEGLTTGGQGVEWHVYGDNANLKNPQTIPDVIKGGNPELEDVSVTHAYTQLYSGNWSYADMIGHELKSETLKPYEMEFKELR
jgi:hypothetical protein